jgi:hypothetical protein
MITREGADVDGTIEERLRRLEDRTELQNRTTPSWPSRADGQVTPLAACAAICSAE